jgi:hypothetical protein
MVSIAGAASVEAVEANVEAGGVVDRVEALGTVFSVDRLCGPWRAELWRMSILLSSLLGYIRQERDQLYIRHSATPDEVPGREVLRQLTESVDVCTGHVLD